MEEVKNNENETKTMVEACDKWLVAFDTLFDKYYEIARLRKYHDAGITLNINISEDGIYRYKIKMNMLKDKQHVVLDGIELRIDGLAECDYVISHIIDKYVRIAKYYEHPESDDCYIDYPTEYAELKISNFDSKQYNVFQHIVKQFYEELRQVKQMVVNANVQEISIHRSSIRPNREADANLLKSLAEAEELAQADIDLDNVKSL